ncbi:MAG TPA: hypothetical protein VLN41_02170, partial [Candidatus Bathyarchaeia archaeon]|nr:hypothetical protein [Candidatus Bathyarchaeia archaeon]
MPETGRVVFVVPEGHPPSGGDLYNRLLFAALRDAGFVFETATLRRLTPRSYPAGTEFWVDSLYIPELGERGPFRPDDRLFFIIHSLPSADPGLAAARAERLRWDEDRLFARAAGFLVTGAGMRGVLNGRGFGR